MFILTALVHPGVLAVLCTGAGLLVDRSSGGFLPGLLLPTVGAAALIAVSQLMTYVSPAAPATPYVMAAIALAGARARAAKGEDARCEGGRRVGGCSLHPCSPTSWALAPVLFAGRPTFSSYLALADSAVHMLGADFLVHHGQDYAHLDLRNSYGQFINAYYNSSYPSGADTLFGGSAFLLAPSPDLGLPAVQRVHACDRHLPGMSARAADRARRRLGRAGSAERHRARARVRLRAGRVDKGDHRAVDDSRPGRPRRPLSALAAKRTHRGHPARPRVAAGVSALGVGFGPWVLAAVGVLVVVLAVVDVRAGRQSRRGRRLGLVGAGAIVTLVSAWPTWIDLSGSLRVGRSDRVHRQPRRSAHAAAAHAAVRHLAVGKLQGSPLCRLGNLTLTYTLVAIAGLAAVLGAFHLIRSHAYALAGWLALMLAVWLVV